MSEISKQLPDECPWCHESVDDSNFFFHFRNLHGFFEPLKLKPDQSVMHDLTFRCTICNESIVRRGVDMRIRMWEHFQNHLPTKELAHGS